MFHYLFTNDLRISNLNDALKNTGGCFKDSCVPSASEDKKADNNNMKTLGFYFNLTEQSNCSVVASIGNVRAVVLNFIKKFQFPNPRTKESLNDSINDGITFAPLRMIISVLYTMQTVSPDSAYLTLEEIADSMFFNENIAKNESPKVLDVINDVINRRQQNPSERFPDDSVLEQRGVYWKQCHRQLREMVKILTWAGCVVEEKGKIKIEHSDLSRENKADLFDILTYKGLWNPDNTKTFEENKSDYQKYMDMECEEVNDIILRNEIEYKNKFARWFKEQKKNDGELYKPSYIAQCIRSIENCYRDFDQYKEYPSPFQIQDSASIEEYIDYLFSAEGFAEYNDSHSKGTPKCAFVIYARFVRESEGEPSVLIYNTNYRAFKPLNRIIFGAPGTGKSFLLKRDCRDILDGTEGSFERVTFHPDYTYSQFVGTYKPVMDDDGKSIRYDYIPGAFIRVYLDALISARSDKPQPHILLIEEINRAKVAAVFGDVFQLLDRDSTGVSEYEIHASEDIKKYLSKQLNVPVEELKTLKIPNNMYIWATMNSADQGVYPMDTAFKRRWTFEYLGIDANEEEISDIGKIVFPGNEKPLIWNDVRKAINAKLVSNEFRINEDKLLGPFFLSKAIVESDENGYVIDSGKFMDAFKSKVLMYLYEDAVKQARSKFFEGCDSSKYSSVCDSFDEIGIGVFGDRFKALYDEA